MISITKSYHLLVVKVVETFFELLDAMWGGTARKEEEWEGNMKMMNKQK